jgi:ribose 5-phosphate isomerase B
MHTLDDATRLARVFLTTGFTDEERHRRRIAMIADYEETGELPLSPSS